VKLTYEDTGADSSTGSHPQRTVTWTVNDGTENIDTTSTVTIDRVPIVNNSTATDVIGATLTVAAADGVLANDTDADGDTLTVSAVDGQAGNVGAALAGIYGHLTLNANGSYSYVADNTLAIARAATGSHPQDDFTYIVSDGNGGTATATLDITIDRLPIVTVSNVTLSQSLVAASSLFTASDPDGGTITEYEFWDNGGGGGHFLLNDVAQTAGSDLYGTASQLAELTYQGGSGTDTVQMRAYDGIVWSAWSAAFTVTAPVDTGPIVTVSNVTLSQSLVAASSLFTASDPDGGTITEYEFWDNGGGGGHFLLNDVAQTAGLDLYVTASQLAELTYQGRSGTDTVQMRAYDGTVWSAWSAAFTVSAPVVSGSAVTPVDSAITSVQGQNSIAAGMTLTLGSAYSGTIAFLSDTGTLQLEDFSSFTGQVSGFGGRDGIDLAGIAFGSQTTLGYSQNNGNAGGTLTINDGTHTANISLLGQYVASQFAVSSDGYGGTLVTDVPQSQPLPVSQPHT
jgi:VCBS repeat-containing protein